MEVRIEFLDKYTNELNQLTNLILSQQEKYDVTADIGQVERLHEALEGLLFVIDNIPLD